IWITNHVEHIHTSVMRRFSYSIYFREPGRKEREKLFTTITHRHNVSGYFSDSGIKTLARNYAVPAAVIESAVTQAKILGCDAEDFVQTSEQFMKSYIRLLHGGREVLRRPTNEVKGFTLSGVTLDGAAIDDIMTRCRRAYEAMKKADGQLEGGCATILFYGPPGTGKTALARHIAYELDRECIVQRGSDLLNCYVGNTEKNIAEVFRKAEDEGAVLVIDEADTFLFRRDMAMHSWEVSQVNEFLTSLEECRCFCICTTNRLKELDSASVRRFSHKVAFWYSGESQVIALYESLLAPLCDSELSKELERELRRMTRLTPGDFHAVRMQYNSYLSDRSEVSHEVLVNALRRELALKHEKG
ncbi:MAG: AAA family ATPase, partial [Synergistaceae bacterium]|nr:AAA family ATPase [Synergistaceae bacterium]